MNNFLSSKSLTIVLASAVVVSLAGCSSNGNLLEKIEGSDNNPNHITTDSKVISLLESPGLEKLPLWDTTVKLPEGWVVNPLLGATTEAEAADGKVPEKYEEILAFNEIQSCYLRGQVSYSNSFHHGKGDLYLSKDYLYERLESKQQTVKNESTANIKLDDKELQFVTGQWEFTSEPLPVPEYEEPVPEGEDVTFDNTPVKEKHYLAVRALDYLKDNPFPALTEGGAPFGTDETKGVPMLVLEYACANASGTGASGASADEATDENWKLILENMFLTFK